MSAGTRNASVFEFMKPEDFLRGSESPYARRTAERLEAGKEGRDVQQPDERIPPWRHDGLAPNWGDG